MYFDKQGNRLNEGITTDVIVYTKDKLLLIQRNGEIGHGEWAIPGGYVNVGKENVFQAASRELFEETGIKISPDKLDSHGNFVYPENDSKAVCISLLFSYNWKDPLKLPSIRVGDDAKAYKWVGFDEIASMDLAFDHKQTLREFMAKQDLYQEAFCKNYNTAQHQCR